MTHEPHDLGDRLTRLLREWHAGTALHSVDALEGGRSSLTYRVKLQHGPQAHPQIVVKVAPAGLPPVRNRDVLRQSRILGVLAAVPGLRVPTVLFEDLGDPPERPPLFAMSFEEGECFEPITDPIASLPPDEHVRGRAVMAAVMLAALHGADPEQLGLGSEVETSAVEEVERWARLFETVEDSLRPRYRECADALLTACPEPLPSKLAHGEFRLGNTLCLAAEVTSVIDWELWCRQDPRFDLAWFLQFADASALPSAIRAAPPGMPSSAELLERYELASGSGVPCIRWFEAHARFKQAAICAIHSKHNRRRSQPDPQQERYAQQIPALIDQSFERLERN